ncbi:MAG: hypothetical protein WAQ99_21010 [Pyrinomonadaceae bacterium]
MDKEEREKLERELTRIDTLYAVCLRDYFATFGAYATATSILLAGVGFVVSAVQSPWVVALLTFIGLYLCLQWHLSTTSMRDQYTHFYVRMVRLERTLGESVMLRWHDAANVARARPALASVEHAAGDHKYLTWSFRQIGRIWALRGASMPVIYSSVFLAIGLAIMLRGYSHAGAVASLTSIVWLILFHILISWETRSARKGNVHHKRMNETKV